MRNPFFVPVRVSEAGTLALRTGRLLSGQRVGLAFTSEALLVSTLGPAARWVELDGRALQDMLAPLGVEQVRIDACPARDPAAGPAVGPAVAAAVAAAVALLERAEHAERHPERLAPVRIRPRAADLGRHAA